MLGLQTCTHLFMAVLGKARQELTTGAEAETTAAFLTLSSCLGMVLATGAWDLLHQSAIKKKYPTDRLTGQADRSCPSNEVPSFPGVSS